MKLRQLIYVGWLIGEISSVSVYAQDTFSIVAIDSVTYEMGSAGASCLDARIVASGVRIISDVIPGKGAVHTQSYYEQANQVNARTRLLLGESAPEIIQWLEANDLAGSFSGGANASIRQYGVVALDEKQTITAAAFTGANCLSVKGHRIGPNYAIQGNILLDESILDSMEARFVQTEGSLAEKLMAAMQGASRPGADRRCLQEGVSSQSAFIRVAKPTDTFQRLYLDLVVPQTAYGIEPIDSLQRLFDLWQAGVSVGGGTGGPDFVAANTRVIYQNPQLRLLQPLKEQATYYVFDVRGKQLVSGTINPDQEIIALAQSLSKGVYWLTLARNSHLVTLKFSVL